MFHPPARPPVRDRCLPRQASERAFTLIELLTVIAIIAILSAITFGIIKGVNQRAAIGQAKAELSVLSQALESYKRQYGDYPQTKDSAVLLQSLIGKKGPTGVAITGKNFLEISKFTPSADPTIDTTSTLQDPWGRNYSYYYKPTASLNDPWTATSYVLYSYGPTINGTPAGGTTEPTSAQPDATGKVNYTDASNLDNIYANRN